MHERSWFSNFLLRFDLHEIRLFKMGFQELIKLRESMFRLFEQIIDKELNRTRNVKFIFKRKYRAHIDQILKLELIRLIHFLNFIFDTIDLHLLMSRVMVLDMVD